MPEVSVIALDVARGERHWTDLRSVGVDVMRTDAGWKFGAWNRAQIVLTRSEVVQGMAHYRDLPEDAREWASFLLAADLYALDDDAVSDALWSLSFGDSSAAAALLGDS